jgi:hypothetical protein
LLGVKFSLRKKKKLFGHRTNDENKIWALPLSIEQHLRYYKNVQNFNNKSSACDSVVGQGILLQAGRSRVRFPMRSFVFNWLNPSSRNMTLVSTQPLTEMSTGNLPGGKGRSARKADNLTAICEPIV